MRSAICLALCLPLVACTVYVDGEGKEQDGEKLHISISGFGGVKGNGKLVSQTRAISAVKTVELDSSVDLSIELAAGTTPSLVVEADENLQSMVQTVMEGDRLVIRSKGSFSTRNPMHATLKLPSLERAINRSSGDMTLRGLDAERFVFDASGPGDVHLSGKAKRLEVAVSGSGDLALEGLDSEHLQVRMSGPGNVSGTGRVAGVDAQLSGSGDLKLSNLSGPAEVRLDGPGGAELTGKVASLQAWVGGSGGVTVQGLDGGTVSVEGHGPGDVQLMGRASSLKLALSGSGDLEAGSLSVADVEASMSGPGNASLGSVQAERFKARLSGSGDLSASGKAKTLDIEVSGPGNASLAGLVAQDAQLQSSGSGDIEAAVMANLKAHTSGPGEIQVHGKPTVRELQGKGIQIQG
ncbi:GIN domain-containing protein [Chitinimonas sp.]|uniref:GIN domain-containing protein n=1 Tax=Chitinimonas sp. TaxID=1934313 RepID=UPI002F94FC59